ncbi:MAG: Maf family protein [Verrucomicrobia bacterium]|jgi:septum formation protein|nr:Maf family protein [Verrucomicrobiota bacterium]
MRLPPVILASVSPRRIELLKQLDLDFLVVPSEVSELHHEELSAGEISQLNAYRKARQVAKQHPDCLVIGADTLVSLGTRLYGKPSSRQHATEMLVELAGRTHSVTTGVCLLHLRGHRQQVFAETSFVTFHPLSPARIETYLARVNPLDKAGAYAIQESGELIVENVIGSFTNVVGLPLARLREELLLWG